jgi:hypothetical protein
MARILIATDSNKEKTSKNSVCLVLKSVTEPGADMHCGVNAPGYRDYQINNWLDETLG